MPPPSKRTKHLQRARYQATQKRLRTTAPTATSTNTTANAEPADTTPYSDTTSDDLERQLFHQLLQSSAEPAYTTPHSATTSDDLERQLLHQLLQFGAEPESANASDIEIPGAWPAWSEAEDTESDDLEDSEDSESDDDSIARDGEHAGDRATLTVGQPAAGWAIAEGLLPGSKAPKSQSYTARWKRKRRAEIKEATMKQGQASLQSTFGDIRRFFFSPTSQPELPFNFVAPNFNQPENKDVHKQLLDDIAELELWIKKNKPDLSTPWGKRIDNLLRLLKRQRKRLEAPGGQEELVKDSYAIAIEIDRGKKYAKSLRRWKREWSQYRTIPPKSRGGLHVKTETLYEDEGILVTVREYLNAVRKVTPKGVCGVVSKLLQSRKVAAHMGMETVLSSDLESPSTVPLVHEKGISIRTAIRWLGKLGWIYSRDKKGYVDGHEREDVVEYREKIFIPRWLVRLLATLLLMLQRSNCQRAVRAYGRHCGNG
jgi:hypothetical protein